MSTTSAPSDSTPAAAPRRFVAPKLCLIRRINLRMALLGALAFFFIGAPFFIWARQALSGGVIDHGSYVDVNLKAMSSFELDQINGQPSDVPDKFRALEGRRVRMVGEMWAPNDAGDGAIGHFQLVYSITQCCFSGPPLAQCFVDCDVVPGHEVDYYDSGLVSVWGIMHVRFRRDPDGVIKSIYEVNVYSVKPM
jgi:hypothetical protein